MINKCVVPDSTPAEGPEAGDSMYPAAVKQAFIRKVYHLYNIKIILFRESSELEKYFYCLVLSNRRKYSISYRYHIDNIEHRYGTARISSNQGKALYGRVKK